MIFDFSFKNLLATESGGNVWLLLAVGFVIVLVIGGISLASGNYNLSNIKSRTVGDGQHGTARWANAREKQLSFSRVPFRVKDWRNGKNRPTKQGLVLGCVKHGTKLSGIVDSDDIHCLMIGASGVGKTAFFLYPNLEYACASGMSFLALDTKGGATRCDTRSALQVL